MGLITAIKDIFKRETPVQDPVSEHNEPTTSRLPYSSFLDIMSIGMAGSSMSVSTVYRCVNFLADSVSNLPMRYLEQRGGIYVENPDNRLNYLLGVQPNPWMSAVDFWRQVVVYMLNKGNAYIVPIYGQNLVIDRFILVSPGSVSHDTINDRYTISDLENGVNGTYDENEIIHIKNYSLDGKQGLSTLSYARLTVDIARRGDTEAQDRIANGGAVRGIVGNEASAVTGFGEYADAELEKTADDIEGQFRSGRHIAYKPGSVSWTPIAQTSADMQFLETRKFTVAEICRFFGVHPSFVFADSGSNYKSAEMANVAFLSTTLNPLLRKIEIELQRKLLSPKLVTKRKFEFDRRGLYACDLQTDANYRKTLLESGQVTVNELRKQNNMPPVANGDKVLVSANLKTIEALISEGGEQKPAL